VDLTQALQTGNIGYILLAFGAITIVFLWRQNQWLTKQLLKIATENSIVMSNLLAELKIAPEKRLEWQRRKEEDPS
jgi:hypothetical protein